MRNPFRRRERRSVGEWGSSAIPSPTGAPATFADVDLRRPESSYQAVAVWASVNLLANLIASLPRDVYRGRGAARVTVTTVPQLLRDPAGDGYGMPDWLKQYVFTRELRGNVYGQALYTAGRPDQIVLLYPDDVTGKRDRDSGKPEWRIRGRRVDAMWHRRIYPVPGQLQGLSPVAHHALSIGQNIASARFGAAWFIEGMHAQVALRNELHELTGAQAQEVKTRVTASTRGSREPLVLGKGWAAPEVISVSPEESQFLATQQYTAADCARIFGPGLAEILGYTTGGNLTYSTPEGRKSDLLTFTLDPRLVELEDMFSDMLPGGQYLKFNRNALLRTNLLDRYRAHNIGIASHFMTPNEAREFEDWAPLTAEQLAELAELAPVMPVGFDQSGAKP